MVREKVQLVTLVNLSVNVPDRAATFSDQSGTFKVWVPELENFITDKS